MADNHIANAQKWAPAIIASVLAVLGLWCFFALFFSALKIDTPAEYTQVISSLFTPVAVFVALYSLNLQQKNFNSQINELRADSFQKMFDLLLKMHEKSASEIAYNGKNGRECISSIIEEFKKSAFIEQLHNNLYPDDNDSKLKDDYTKFVVINYAYITPYMNTLSLLLHAVDEGITINDTKKKLYIDTVKARYYGANAQSCFA